MEKFVTGTGQTLSVHSAEDCLSLKHGKGCPIHCPSDHHMKDWILHWRDDRRIFERICKHGIGHPDPDDAAFRKKYLKDDDTVHGCDGCCKPPKFINNKEMEI